MTLHRKHRTLKLVVSYEGTDFAGWQRQKNARSVQGTLEEAFQKITGSKVHVTGASRTDSGVHAQGQVAHVCLHSALPLATLQKALNALLPQDIVIRSIQQVKPTFHARYHAKKKLYRYSIWNRSERPLFDRAHLLHIPKPLDVKKMRKALPFLKGRHDFKAFHSTGRPVHSTVRTLSTLRIRSKEGNLLIEAEADGFLYHMVRRLVGFLIEIGKGKHPPSITQELLRGRSRVIPPTAPAKGLALIHVRY